jgi:diguanylate cyclase (GGDEF)-like protein
MRFKSIGSRIITIFLALILLVQLTGFFIIRASIDKNAVASTREQINIGEEVLSLLLEQNSQKMAQGVNILAADYSFKQTVASNDMPAIQSAITNSSARIGAAFSILVGPDQNILASTIKLDPALLGTVLGLTKHQYKPVSPATNAVHDKVVYQFVAAPVNSPEPIGWVVMAFPVGGEFVNAMRQITSLDLSIMTLEGEGKWHSSLSTLSAADTKILEAMKQKDLHITLNSQNLPARIGNENYSARHIILVHNSNQKAEVILLRSISDAIAPYQQLQLTLLILTALSIIVVFLASVSAVRRITLPLRNLSLVAAKLGAGDYESPILHSGDDEIADLSRALESMRVGISNREGEISRLAYWDTLTDLPNRAQFTKLLQQEIIKSKDEYRPFCLLMMDLDRFKHVNDVLGHSFGDALLRHVAKRISGQIPKGAGQLARLGGDEFAILLMESSLADAQRVAANILVSFEIPIAIEDQTVDLGAGIGIATFPTHGLDAETLLSHAELAMYEAKRSGNASAVYDTRIDNTSEQNLSMLSELRSAIDNNEFLLFVQPKVNLATGQVIGCESLVRWDHPHKGMVMPDRFIPFAEKTGFIRTLTQWMLEQSAILASTLKKEGFDIKISVNLSARDLLDHDLPVRFSKLLQDYQVQAGAFCLEITESSIMDDPERALQTLESLHTMGVDLSIDDFGTGYSSLAYLKRLPVDELKIDKSFVMNMAQDHDDAMIVRSTIDLGHNMGLRVVAEGIETDQVWNILATMGCDHGQGYFMSKAMPSRLLIEWIKSWNAAHTK